MLLGEPVGGGIECRPEIVDCIAYDGLEVGRRLVVNAQSVDDDIRLITWLFLDTPGFSRLECPDCNGCLSNVRACSAQLHPPRRIAIGPCDVVILRAHCAAPQPFGAWWTSRRTTRP